MKFTYKELLTSILNSVSDNDELVEVLDKMHKSNSINHGFYLKHNEEDDSYECWFRNTDENGTVYHGPTNYDASQVAALYVKQYRTEKNMTR